MGYYIYIDLGLRLVRSVKDWFSGCSYNGILKLIHVLYILVKCLGGPM